MTRARALAVWQELRSIIVPRTRQLILGLGLVVINRISSLVLPYSNRFLVDNVIVRHQTNRIPFLCLALVAAISVQALSTFALSKVFGTSSHEVIAELREKLQLHIGRLRIQYYDLNKSGAILTRIMWDVVGIRNLIGVGFFDLVGGLVTSILAAFTLFRISPVITVLLLVVLVSYGYIISYNSRRIRPMFRAYDSAQAEVMGRLMESISGIRVVKAFNAERQESAAFTRGLKDLFLAARRSIDLTSRMAGLSTIVMGTMTMIVVVVGGWQLINQRLTLGEFVTLTAFLAILAAPVTQIVSIGRQLAEAFASLERTREVFREVPEDREPQRHVALPRLCGAIVFENVSFCYPSGARALSGVNFSVLPGTTLALVGRSGAGKSTIISLLTSLYRPETGRILIDGFDLSEVILSTYRSQLGLVLQDPFLFSGTIADNVAFGRQSASREDIIAACRLAFVDEFAERCEGGYDCLVGERGVTLSGGQRQRLSIARAVLVNPKILVLDEALVNLDVESEELVRRSLLRLMKDRTTIVIAHELSTIMRADQIIFLDSGEIVQNGTHQELISAAGPYRDLFGPICSNEKP